MMKKIIRRDFVLGLSAALIGAPARAQASLSPRQWAEQPPETITDVRVETFTLGASAQGGMPWKVFLARPSSRPARGGFPVLYLLDGNASFPAAWHALNANESLRTSELAVVGIGYPDNMLFNVARRYYDLTPYAAAEYRQSRGSNVETGGQERFLDFIANDVRHAVAQRIPVDPHRQALFGHSLGGLFTLHTLYTRPELFQTYIAADPSIWWNGQSVLQEEAGFLAGIRAAGGHVSTPTRVLMENSGQPSKYGSPAGASAKAGSTSVTTQGTSAHDCALRLARIPGMHVAYRRLENETHGSMMAAAVSDALTYTLKNTIGETFEVTP